jgi:hypothetical protein
MLAWHVRRLRLVLLTGPGDEMLHLLGSSLESLAVAPEKRAWQQLGGLLEESDDDRGDPGEEEHPGWAFGSGSVGSLLQLPPGLLSLEAGSLVECPVVALGSAPGLRHVSLDAASGCG